MRLVPNTLTALGVAMIAAVMLFLGGPPGPGLAHEAAAIPNKFVIHKHCDGFDSGTFNALIDFNFNFLGGGSGPAVPGPNPNSNTAFDTEFPIQCDEVVVIGNEDTDDINLEALYNWFTTNIASIDEANVEVEETQPPGTALAGSGNACSFQESAAAFSAELADGFLCELTNILDLTDQSSLQIEKLFPGGDPTAEFRYLVEPQGVCVVVAGGVITAIISAGTFAISPGEVLAVYCRQGVTVTEQPGPGFVFVPPPACNSDEVTIIGASVSYGFPPTTSPVTILCTFTNAVTDDSPDVPNIWVTKICVGDGFDAEFAITIGSQTEAVLCNLTTVLVDVAPGDYPVSEQITGVDADGFSTVIVCGDGEVVAGRSTTVTVDTADVSCVIINSFDPGLEDLICSCTCCMGDIEIDIGNENTNVIGIENENENKNANTNDNNNENTNTNTNTQDQDNAQDQDNSNNQTNNITSSPEVNIDFE
jgi:hypothetical protein